MKTFTKAAIVAFGATCAFAAAPASAQPYDPYNPAYGDQGYEGDYYDQGYDPGYDQYAEYGAYGEYGDDAYGYCDEYGCPEDYYDLPIYDGEVYYNGLWLTGPLYYRDWGGGRQFWVHGGWRSSQYRGGNFRRALGRNWYRQNRAFRSGFNNRSAYRGNNNYRQRSYGQQRSYSGRSSFSSGGSGQRFRGNNDVRSQWSNRQGFGQSGGYRQRNVQTQQTFTAPQQQQQRSFGGWRQRNFGQAQAAPQQSGGGGWRQRQAARQQSAPQAQAAPSGGRNWGNRGGGGRGDGGGRGRRDRN